MSSHWTASSLGTLPGRWPGADFDLLVRSGAEDIPHERANGVLNIKVHVVSSVEESFGSGHDEDCSARRPSARVALARLPVARSARIAVRRVAPEPFAGLRVVRGVESFAGRHDSRFLISVSDFRTGSVTFRMNRLPSRSITATSHPSTSIRSAS